MNQCDRMERAMRAAQLAYDAMEPEYDDGDQCDDDCNCEPDWEVIAADRAARRRGEW